MDQEDSQDWGHRAPSPHGSCSALPNPASLGRCSPTPSFSSECIQSSWSPSELFSIYWCEWRTLKSDQTLTRRQLKKITRTFSTVSHSPPHISIQGRRPRKQSRNRRNNLHIRELLEATKNEDIPDTVILSLETLLPPHYDLTKMLFVNSIILSLKRQSLKSSEDSLQLSLTAPPYQSILT